MDDKLRILILEDVSADAELMEYEIRKGGISLQSQIVKTRQAFLQGITKFKPDLILADYKLPSFDGITALALAREKSPEVPFIFVSGTLGEEVAVEALKGGATDYVSKGRLSRLVPCIHRAMREVEAKKQQRISEKALKESEEKYRTLLETIDDAGEGVIVLINSEEREAICTFANRSVSTITGYSSEEIRQLSWLDLVHPSDREAVLPRYRRRMRGEENPGIFEISLLRKDGSEAPIEVSGATMDIQGSKAIVATIRDISGRKKSEREIMASEIKFRTLFDNNFDAMLIADPQSRRYLECNRKAEEILGYSKEEILSKKLGDFSPGELKVPSFGAGEEFSLGTELKREWEVVNKGGKTIPVEIDFKLLQIDGSPHMLVIFRDITARKQAEEDLRKSEEQYRRLVELSPDMIMLHDQKKYIYLNPAALKAFGALRPEEMVGRSIFEFLHPEYWELVKARLRLLVQGEEISPMEEKFIRLDKKIIDVEVAHAQTLYYDKPMILVVARDITEKKRTEEEKAAFQAQFYQAQKIEAIGQLAGGFAHDFNNSLTLMSVCSQLILMSLAKNDPLRERIETIYSAIGRSANLARQLLAFSRRQIMEVKVINLNTLLREIDKMIRRVIGENIKLDLHLDQNLGATKVDPGQMEQVVINLLINARDSMPNGGNLTVQTRNIDLGETIRRLHPEIIPGRYVSISVEDTGVGIPPGIQKRIFEPFFTTKEEGKGTGLGLSSAYGIIKQSEGYIYVESEPGKGTTFRIYIPRIEEPVIEEEKEVSGKELPGGGEAILVVEDEKDLREFIVEVLRRQGYKVWEASNGGEAFLFWEKRKETIDLMVTDVIMPGMSGKELADRLQPLQPEMKILYISGYSYDVIAPHGVLMEGINFIQKPFTVEGLAGRVRKVLDQEKIRGPVQVDLLGLKKNI